MILVITDQINTSMFPWWIVPVIIHLIGAVVAARSVNPSKKLWQKILFVIFWPWFLIRFIIGVTAWARQG